MYPLFRLGSVCLRAALSKTIEFDSVSKTSFWSMPWDMDPMLEMNNGRILTLYDLGRFDLTIRTSFFKTLFKKKWGVVVAGGSVRYRQRIGMFDKVTVLTRIVGFEGRWIYIVQSMRVKGKPASSVLFRTGITRKGRAVPVEAVLKEINMPNLKSQLPDWVRSWIISERDRPWPPSETLTE